jgi:hypothetical protein
MDLTIKCLKTEPNADIINEAIKFLTNPRAIKEFYEEYINHSKNQEEPEGYKQIANKEIYHALLGYNNAIVSKWKKTIPEIADLFI